MLRGRRLLCAVLALHALAACVSLSGAVGISDLVWWGADMLTDTSGDGGQRDDAAAAAGAAATAGVAADGAAAKAAPGPQRTCHCSGPACMCCLDFNMTYIDLGGPGCVRLRYLGQDAGVAMNVSYGDSLLHSEVVKDSSPSGTCMDILSSLAQVCARFTSLGPMAAQADAVDAGAEATEGMKRGCLQLEPTLLGEVQASYPVGCFRMTPQSMTMEPQAAAPATSPPGGPGGPAEEGQGEAEGASTGTTEAPTTPTDISAESLIAAVSETAEQGIDLLTNWLGLALEEDNNSTTTEAQDASTSTASPPEENTSARAYRQSWVSLV